MICDLAETYHILNYKGLSSSLVATLVLGLRDDSRVKMFVSDAKLTVEQVLYARMVDTLEFIAWTYTKDARKGRQYKEKSVLKALQGEYENEKDDLLSFATIEEYEEHMKKFIL